MKKSIHFLLGGLCLFLSAFSPVWAQTSVASSTSVQNRGTISGVVTDAATGKPIEFATVALTRQNATQSLDGVLTNDKGAFTLNSVPVGTYEVKVSFVGYVSQQVSPVIVAEQQLSVHVAPLQLSPEAHKLKEVTVVGQKPLIEDKVDRLVYNADQDISNSGGNAADVLRKVPSLSVDMDGNVQLRGSANVRVLVNNKTSTLMATSLADALRQIPADMIKSVEVITSPSAKYDAEGSAGIINIITKKNTLQGLTGNAGGLVGTQSQSFYSSLSTRRQKWGVTLGASAFRYDVPKGFGMYRREFAEGEDIITRQEGEGKVYGGGSSAQLGLDYDLDSANLFSLGIKFNQGRYQGKNEQITTTTSSAGYPYIRNTNQYQYTPLGLDLNLDYTHIFQPQQELTVLAQFSQSDHGNFVDQDHFTQADDLFYLQRNTNQNSNQEITFQTDYTHPVTNNATLEVGLKAILRNAQSDGRYDIRFPLEGRALPDQNSLNYQQDVAAGYLSYGFKMGKHYALKVGGRYEHTWLSGDFTTTQTSLSQRYHIFIPSFSVSRTFKENHTVKVNYTQRIQRPHIFLLNPYRDSRDPKSVFYGNPALEPERTHLYELGYSTFFNTSSLTSSLYVRQIDNAIQMVTLQIEDGVAQNTYVNAGNLLSYGLTVAGSVKPLAALSVNGDINWYYNQLQGAGFRNAGWQYNLNLTTGYEFGKGFTGQFSGLFGSSRVTLQGRALPWQQYSLAVKKEFWNKKASLTLAVNNPFTKSVNFGQETVTDAFVQTNENRNFNRALRLSFDYKFGQQNASKNPARKKKTIRNDDVKQGE
ncbi:TonB-dependent receptor [Nibribacter ruber]|uniref:TonB-dependent receptor n=1 Tax=Nibribacter ruber TaxID=2698458 RepID=A0A6P1P0N4_9BACT|nr:outer membrane beta-barrel family protein [Nibribacter ruber]QHL87911.1 TonB-dependent receptor [Nibribacter ruber]